MSVYTQVQKYIADTFQIELVLKQPTLEDAKTRLKNFLLAKTLRNGFCGENFNQKDLEDAFFTNTSDPEYGTKNQKKTWPTIIFARNPRDSKEYYGFIVYYDYLTVTDTKRLQAAMTQAGSELNLLQANPAKIVALCTVGGNKCVGQSLLAAALAEEEKRDAWIVDMPVGLTSNGQLVERFFNQFLFHSMGSGGIGGRTYLVAETQDLTAELLIDLLANCHTKHPQISAQAAAEVKHTIDVVAGEHPEQPQEILAGAVLNAISPGAAAPVVMLPVDVQSDVNAAVAEAANALKSVALDAKPDLAEPSAQAMAAEALQEAAVVAGSRLSRKQKVALFGVLTGGLIGLGGILKLAARARRRGRY